MGKYHLIPENEALGEKEICGTRGVFLWTAFDVWLRDGIFYEVTGDNKNKVPLFELESCYCKKCITKALKQQAKLSSTDKHNPFKP